MISEHDRLILRDLARRQADLAVSPKNQEKVRLWKRHGEFAPEIPTIHIEIGSFAHEVIDPMLTCETEKGRSVERQLLNNFVNQEMIEDDTPIPNYFGVEFNSSFCLFGHEISVIKAEDSTGGQLGHQFNHVIHDLAEDYDKLGESTYAINLAATKERFEELSALFGDLLPVKMQGRSLYAVPTQKIVHLMGMENMLFAMCDAPTLFLEMMNRIAADYRSYFQALEKSGCLLSTTGFEPLGNGTFCFTDELPTEGALKTNQVWGFLDSQETVGVSPEMFHELVFPCYEKIAAQYGLLSYGCCEPVDPFWADIERLPNLRKVSISAWCDQYYMGERLRGKNIAFHRKPTPNLLGVDRYLDEEAVREHIRETLEAARGCTIEFAQRDVYTVHHDLDKVRRYVKIIREEINQHYKPL